MTENFEALLEESLAAVVMKPGELIIGDVVEAKTDSNIFNEVTDRAQHG